MREERGILPGDLTIDEPFTLWGSVGGNVTVRAGGKLYVRGAIYGDLTLEPGARAHILGTLSGNLTLSPDTKCILSGLLGGSAYNDGGRLYIDHTAKVMGKLRTSHNGKTQHQPSPSASPD